MDPKSPKSKGIIPVPIGSLWFKNISIRGGVVAIRLYQQLLKNLIESGRATPSFVFTHEYNIEEGVKAFEEFSNHEIIKAVFRFKGGNTS